MWALSGGHQVIRQFSSPHRSRFSMSLLHVARFPRDPLDWGREAEDESRVEDGELISRGKTHWLCPAVRGDTDQKIQLFYTLFFSSTWKFLGLGSYRSRVVGKKGVENAVSSPHPIFWVFWMTSWNEVTKEFGIFSRLLFARLRNSFGGSLPWIPLSSLPFPFSVSRSSKSCQITGSISSFSKWVFRFSFSVRFSFPLYLMSGAWLV